MPHKSALRIAENKGIKSKSYANKTKLQNGVHKGDVVQSKNGDGKWFHTIIITAGKKGNWKYCGHTNNRLDYQVEKISNATAFRALEF